jgi:hypothetical protein
MEELEGKMKLNRYDIKPGGLGRANTPITSSTGEWVLYSDVVNLLKILLRQFEKTDITLRESLGEENEN